MNNNQIIDMQCNETTGRMMRPVAYIKSDFTSKFGGRAVWQTLKPRSISIRNIRTRRL